MHFKSILPPPNQYNLGTKTSTNSTVQPIICFIYPKDCFFSNGVETCSYSFVEEADYDLKRCQLQLLDPIAITFNHVEDES